FVAAFSTALINGVVVSSPKTIPPTPNVPVACAGSPLIMTTLLVFVSAKPTPSRFPDGVPEAAEIERSTSSLPLVGSKGKGVVKFSAISNGHGSGPGQPDEAAFNGAS